MSPFVILALPRSRTAWMAHFLSYPGLPACGHDIGIECNTVGDFLDCFNLGMPGTVETGAMIGWRALVQELPGVKLVTVRRPLPEVQASLARFGVVAVPGELEARDQMLDQVEAVPGTRRLAYSDLRSPFICQWLFEHCLERAFDLTWWTQLAQINIQVNMADRLEQLRKRAGPLAKLKRELECVAA